MVIGDPYMCFGKESVARGNRKKLVNKREKVQVSPSINSLIGARFGI